MSGQDFYFLLGASFDEKEGLSSIAHENTELEARCDVEMHIQVFDSCCVSDSIIKMKNTSIFSTNTFELMNIEGNLSNFTFKISHCILEDTIFHKEYGYAESNPCIIKFQLANQKSNHLHNVQFKQTSGICCTKGINSPQNPMKESIIECPHRTMYHIVFFFVIYFLMRFWYRNVKQCMYNIIKASRYLAVIILRHLSKFMTVCLQTFPQMSVNQLVDKINTIRNCTIFKRMKNFLLSALINEKRYSKLFIIVGLSCTQRPLPRPSLASSTLIFNCQSFVVLKSTNGICGINGNTKSDSSQTICPPPEQEVGQEGTGKEKHVEEEIGRKGGSSSCAEEGATCEKNFTSVWYPHPADNEGKEGEREEKRVQNKEQEEEDRLQARCSKEEDHLQARCSKGGAQERGAKGEGQQKVLYLKGTKQTLAEIWHPW